MRAKLVVTFAVACALGVACSAGSTSTFTDAGAGAESGASDGSTTADSGTCTVSSGGCVCIPGGGTVGGAQPMCPPSVIECNTDTDCKLIDGAAPSSPMVCLQEKPCPESAASGQCIAACVMEDSQCLPDEMCATSGHCVPKQCSVDTDCPAFGGADYACSAAKTCAPQPCGGDLTCSAGHYCVNGNCFDQAGQCALLAP